jgi:hypothetical protein
VYQFLRPKATRGARQTIQLLARTLTFTVVVRASPLAPCSKARSHTATKAGESPRHGTRIPTCRTTTAPLSRYWSCSSRLEDLPFAEGQQHHSAGSRAADVKSLKQRVEGQGSSARNPGQPTPALKFDLSRGPSRSWPIIARRPKIPWEPWGLSQRTKTVQQLLPLLGIQGAPERLVFRRKDSRLQPGLSAHHHLIPFALSPASPLPDCLSAPPGRLIPAPNHPLRLAPRLSHLGAVNLVRHHLLQYTSPGPASPSFGIPTLTDSF